MTNEGILLCHVDHKFWPIVPSTWPQCPEDKVKCAQATRCGLEMCSFKKTFLLNIVCFSQLSTMALYRRMTSFSCRQPLQSRIVETYFAARRPAFFFQSVLRWSVAVSTICRHSSCVVTFLQVVVRPKFRGPRSASIARS